LLVVIDEVERIEDGIVAGWCTTDVLDFLRAAGEDLLRIRFLLLSAYTLRRLGRHWTDRLISVTVRPLSYLADADARELICLPVDDFPAIYPEGGVERIVAATRGHPYLVQKTCDNLVKLLNARAAAYGLLPMPS
jgi:AAA+ ATPase superfamily predicted ATPase